MPQLSTRHTARRRSGEPSGCDGSGTVVARTFTARSRREASALRGGVAAEQRDLVDVLVAQRLVAHPEAFFGREAEHTELALAQVLVHVVRGVAGALEREHLRQRGMDLSLTDQ